MNGGTQAVMTDATANEILKQLQIMGALQQETRDILAEQASAMRAIGANLNAEPEIYFAPVLCTAKDDGSLECELDGIAFDDILGAYEAGKFVILRIVYGENVYFATFVDFQNQTVPIGTVKTFTFFAHTLGGKQCTVLVYRMTKKDGTVIDTLSANPSGLDASQVACKITIGDVQYNTLDAVLGAIVAALG